MKAPQHHTVSLRVKTTNDRLSVASRLTIIIDEQSPEPEWNAVFLKRALFFSGEDKRKFSDLKCVLVNLMDPPDRRVIIGCV
jgi:hypothetical protein